MNVIVIHCDSLRRDHLGIYGNEWVKTPNLDRFAQRATIFDHAYVGSYPCLPNRRDVWTGRYEFPFRGWGGLERTDCEWSAVMTRLTYRPGCQLPEPVDRPPERTCMLILDNWLLVSPDGNYHRTFSGWEFIRGQEGDRWITDRSIQVRFPCAPEKLRQPYREIVQHYRNNRWRVAESQYHAPRVMQAAMDWLDANHTDRDFCLWIDCYDPHEPWDPPRSYRELYDPGYTGEEVISPRYGWADIMTEPELRHMRALYAAEVTMVDRWVGLLLDKIEQLGLLENTLLIFTSDHGTLLGEHGVVGKPWAALGADPNLYDELARIPLIVYMPRAKMSGTRLDTLVQPVDLFPTILEAVGLGERIPADVHGRSLLPLLRGERTVQREHACYGRYHEAVNVTDGRWTAFVWPEGDERSALYDCAEDPGQQRNLLHEAPEQFGRLWQAAQEWLGAIGAPDDLLRRAWQVPVRFPQ